MESKETRHHPITELSVARLLLYHSDQWSNNGSTDTTFLGCFDEKTIIKSLGYGGNWLNRFNSDYRRDVKDAPLVTRSVLQSLVWSGVLKLSYEVDSQGNYHRIYYVGIDGWDNLKKIKSDKDPKNPEETL